MKITVVKNDNKIYPVGLTRTNKGIHVSVAAVCKTCSLVLYEHGAKNPCRIIPFEVGERTGDVWHLTIEGRGLEKLEYCYLTDDRYTADPYGRSYIGHEEWGKLENAEKPLRCPVQICDFDWENDFHPGLTYNESVIYRIHTRGFTKHSSSKMEDKGTFKAVMDKLPYIKDLGATTIEMMPPFEFSEVIVPGSVEGNPYGQDKPTGKLNYWGYVPGYYFAPKASYTSKKDRDPVKEFKTLVKSIHNNGMELIIELFFSGKDSPSYVLDVARFWVREFHVDGIHLIGSVPAKLIGEDAYLSRTKLLATSWDGVSPGFERHLGEYNDGFLVDMRRLLKSDEGQINNLIFRSRRNPDKTGVVNYIANTNGFCMMDMVSYDIKHNEANGENNQDGTDYNYSWNCGVEGYTRKKKIVECRKKQIRNALLLVFLSQGTPLILSGDEFGNSQSGNNNAYCQDNDISWLDWNKLKTNKDIYDFTKHIISFRKRHSVFHMEKEPMVLDYKACGHPDISYHGVNAWQPEFENYRRQLGIMYCGEYGTHPDGSRDDYFYVAYNMHWEPHEFFLPNLPKDKKWTVSINTSAEEINGYYEEGNEEELADQKSFVVPGRTIVVFKEK